MKKTEDQNFQAVIHPAINLEKLTPDQKADLGYKLEQGDDIFEQDYALAVSVYTSAAEDWVWKQIWKKQRNIT